MSRSCPSWRAPRPAALAGCEVGPNYRLPPVAGACRRGICLGHAHDRRPTPAAADWWRLYQDAGAGRPGAGRPAAQHRPADGCGRSGPGPRPAQPGARRPVPLHRPDFRRQFRPHGLGDFEASPQARGPRTYGPTTRGWMCPMRSTCSARSVAPSRPPRPTPRPPPPRRIWCGSPWPRRPPAPMPTPAPSTSRPDVARRSVQMVQQTYDIALRQRDAGAASDLDFARAATLLDQTKAQMPTLDGPAAFGPLPARRPDRPSAYGDFP